jgi:hypothetical protein
MKKILTELDNIAFGSIGTSNATNNFMTKYHENHSYENCRLIKINESFPNNVWREILKKIGLDLLCVAVHYSKRYENSDKFIENKTDEDIKNYAYYLKNSKPSEIVSEFCNKYIISASNDIQLEWKNLHFLWKQFLSTSDLPNIIYSNSLKNILKHILFSCKNLKNSSEFTLVGAVTDSEKTSTLFSETIDNNLANNSSSIQRKHPYFPVG